MILSFLHLSAIPLLLLVAAMMAASETALFSLTPSQLEAIRSKFVWVHQKIQDLMSKPESLLSTLVISNECVSIALGTLVTTLLRYSFDWDQKWVFVASILVSASLLLLVSEILPKVIAFRFPMIVASVMVYPLSWVHALVSPLRIALLFLARAFIHGRPFSKEPRTVSEEEFRVLVEVGEQSGSLESTEKDLILNVFDLSDLTVATIMTPWKKVFTIYENTSLEEFIQKIRERPFSRIPILSKSEKVVGILHVKELTKLLTHQESQDFKDSQSFFLQKALSQAFVVPQHIKVAGLFRDFQSKKVHLALVVNEYGKNIGVVTLDDILNALFRLREKR